jgi:hypothetical protein
MNIESVDPRDIRWEQHSPTYRVYFSERGTSDEYEVTESDIPEVLAWADDEARRTNRSYVAWLRVQDPQQGPGLIRLSGWEQPSEDRPGKQTRPSYAVDHPTG